jgi:hypothetical protein
LKQLFAQDQFYIDKRLYGTLYNLHLHVYTIYYKTHVIPYITMTSDKHVYI